MRDFLIFRLYGSMVSWGDIAVGEYRPSFPHPSKSAVLGIVAAALGIRRDQENELHELTKTYGFAVRVDAGGSLLRDYHTVQRPSASRGVVYETRKDELSEGNLNTTLSSRDYYCDALSLACLWIREAAHRFSLSELQAALEKPFFQLYLGRKACPPALPLKPRVVSAGTLRESFQHYPILDTEFLVGLPRAEATMIHWDDLPNSGLEADHIVKRRDVPFNRKAWQFSERYENHVSISRDEGS